MQLAPFEPLCSPLSGKAPERASLRLQFALCLLLGLATIHVTAAPAITSISPNAGPLAGGQSVAITGTELTGATSVTFDGIAASSFTVDSATQITATTPAHAAGSVDVVVVTAGGTATSTDGYAYTSLIDVSDPPVLPVGHSPIIGLGIVGSRVLLTTTVEAYETPHYPGGVFAKVFDVSDVGVQLDNDSFSLPPGLNPAVVYFTGGAFQQTLYTYKRSPPGQTGVALTGFTARPGGIAEDGTGAIYLSNVSAGTTGVAKFPDASTGTPTLIFGTVGSGAGELVAPRALAFGPDGLLYVLDSGSNQIVSFTTDGVHQRSFALTDAAEPTSIAISPTRRLYTANGNGGGNIYDLCTGASLGSFTASATFPEPPGSGKTSLLLDGQGYLYVYDVATGLHLFADPESVTATATITSVVQNAGPSSGGQSVTITGTNLGCATSVTFGGTAATSFTVDSPTQITATTPAHAAGAVDVVVNTAGNTATLTAGYTFADAPTIGTISPNAGPLGGGQSVTITGTNLTNATSVTFDGIAATTFVVDLATQITAMTPAHAAGIVNVIVTTAGGSANTNYTYIAGPTIGTISPNAGPLGGGQNVTITGTDLTGTTSVTFDAIAATSFIVDSATQITATTPAHAAGVVDVVITTAGGSATSTGGYTYTSAPILTSISPSAGPVAGGQIVTITGSSLSGATAVTFGGVAATSFTVDSPTQITATTPAHAAGAVDVIVTTPGGPVTSSNGYTYASAPAITNISPNAGPLAGGQIVTITGASLSGATTVTFGGVAASFTIDSPTQITVTTPANAAGAGDVVIVTAGGSATSAGGYTYAAPATILSVDPSSGPTSGGQSVTITGADFTGTTSVTFGGVEAASFTVDSPTQITAITPAHSAGLVDVVVVTPGGSDTASDAYLFAAAVGAGIPLLSPWLLVGLAAALAGLAAMKLRS